MAAAPRLLVVFVFVLMLDAMFLLVGDNKLGFAMMREERVRARLSAATSDAVCVWLLLVVVPVMPAVRLGGWIRSPRSPPAPNLAMELRIRRWSAAVAWSSASRNACMFARIWMFRLG